MWVGSISSGSDVTVYAPELWILSASEISWQSTIVLPISASTARRHVLTIEEAALRLLPRISALTPSRRDETTISGCRSLALVKFQALIYASDIQEGTDDENHRYGSRRRPVPYAPS